MIHAWVPWVWGTTKRALYKSFYLYLRRHEKTSKNRTLVILSAFSSVNLVKKIIPISLIFPSELLYFSDCHLWLGIRVRSRSSHGTHVAELACKVSAVNVDLYSASSQLPLMHYCFPYFSADLCWLALSQTPVNTARPWIWTNVSRDVPVYSQLLLVLTVPTHGGIVQAELTWVAGSWPRWFTHRKTVTHPGTNRARHTVTLLSETNALPLSQTATVLGGRHGYQLAASPATKYMKFVLLLILSNVGL